MGYTFLSPFGRAFSFYLRLIDHEIPSVRLLIPKQTFLPSDLLSLKLKIERRPGDIFLRTRTSELGPIPLYETDFPVEWIVRPGALPGRIKASVWRTDRLSTVLASEEKEASVEGVSDLSSSTLRDFSPKAVFKRLFSLYKHFMTWMALQQLSQWTFFLWFSLSPSYTLKRR